MAFAARRILRSARPLTRLTPQYHVRRPCPAIAPSRTLSTTVRRPAKNPFDKDEVIIPTPEQAKQIQAWQRDLGLSDEELVYYTDKYPGIDAVVIANVKQGNITEADIPAAIAARQGEQATGDGLEEQEEDVDLDDFMKDLKIDPEKLEHLGIKQEDFEMFAQEKDEPDFDMDEMEKDPALREMLESFEKMDEDPVTMKAMMDKIMGDVSAEDFLSALSEEERAELADPEIQQGIEEMFNDEFKELRRGADDTYDQVASDETGEVRVYNRSRTEDELFGADTPGRWKQIMGIMGTPDNEKEIEQPGFWNYEEEEGAEEDEEFQGDDITSMGHGELDQHREIREYQRMAAWELPLLNSLAKPFEPPAATQPLRFRYTTYMGEQHPAAKKVVVEFAPKDLPDLTDVQRDKLIKLCGVRYNPGTESVKMSCEAFETQAQNKRYLGDLVDTLLDEARDPKDTFEDVPFDFRHHQPKPFHAFPDEWRLTPERRAKLEAKRKLAIEADAQREAAGQLVDGTAVITEGLKMRGAAEPMLVGAGRRS